MAVAGSPGTLDVAKMATPSMPSIFVRSVVVTVVMSFRWGQDDQKYLEDLKQSCDQKAVAGSTLG